MTSTLAGVYAPNGQAAALAVAEALGAPATARVASSGPLVVAWTGAGRHRQHDGLLCLLLGRISNLETLARRVDAGGSPEQILSAAYRRDGEAMLDGLHGDFVLLVWDGAAGRGLLARDRLGARPLFFSRAGGTLRFASEVRTVLALAPRRPDPNRAAVVQWLVGGALRGGATLYEGLETLEPGHHLRLDGGRVEIGRHWEPVYGGTLSLPREELVGRLREEIAGAVDRSLAGDDAAGILLSGGLDSASVAGVATGALEPPRASAGAYSAVFPRHPSTDESALIDRLTQRLGLRSVRIEVLGGSMLASALAYPGVWQLPLSDPNSFFIGPLLRRAAEDGLELVLDGEGGDELFGAARGLIADRLRGGHPLAAVRLTGRLPGAGERPPWRPLLRLLAVHGVRGALPAGVHQAARQARGLRSFAPSWFTPGSARLLFETHEAGAWKRLPGPRWWAQLADGLTSGIAARGVRDHARRRAQTAGLEAGHPFLDEQLIEFVLRLPPELSFDPHRSRPLLRASVAGLIPDEVRLRAGKTYFDATFYDAMAGHDRSAVRRMLLDPDAEIRAFVDPERLRSDLLDVDPREHPLGARFWMASAWRLATAESWLRAQRDPGFAQRALENWDLRAPSYELHEDPPASGLTGTGARHAP